MAVTAAPYASFLLGLSRAQFNLESDTIKVSLAGSSYLPNMNTHKLLSDVTDIVTAAAAMPLLHKSATYDATNFTVSVSADPVIWSAATFVARWAVIYKVAANTSPLIGYVDFGSERNYSSEDFTLTFTDGFAQIPAV